MGRHKFNIDSKNIAKIEPLLSRLKYSVSIWQIIKWLENFEEDEVDDAIEFLFFLEYIPFSELQSRIDELLSKIINELATAKQKILIVPYGKNGKSGTLMTYPLRNTTAFRKQGDNIAITFDISKYSFSEPTILVLIDDFIGTGDTFIREYPKKIKLEVDSTDNILWKCILAPITMYEAKVKVMELYPDFKLYTEVRNKVFSSLYSPFKIIDFKINTLEKLNHKYGSQIKTQKEFPQYNPLGFRESEALVAFSSGTPNNTLPIIWGNDKWYPIFPRFAAVRMDQAKALKKEVAFYIGVMNRLGLILFDEGIYDENNLQKNHSLITLIKLKKDGYEDVVICQIIGITTNELAEIYEYGKSKEFFDSNKSLMPAGLKFLENLLQRVKPNKFRSSKQENFEMKNSLYLPRQFRGKT